MRKKHIPNLDQDGKQALESINKKLFEKSPVFKGADLDSLCTVFEQLTGRRTNKGCGGCIPTYTQIARNYLNANPEPIAPVKTQSKKVKTVTKIEKNEESKKETPKPKTKAKSSVAKAENESNGQENKPRRRKRKASEKEVAGGEHANTSNSNISKKDK